MLPIIASAHFLIAQVNLPATAQVSSPNWISISQASNGSIYHLDTSNIQRDRNYVNWFQLITYPNATFSIGHVFGDCDNNIIAVASFRDFDINGLALHEENDPAEPIIAYPGTIGYSMLQTACSF